MAALMVTGGMQMKKNVRASHAASAMGVKMRNEARAYVKAYVTTLSGGDASSPTSRSWNTRERETRADACASLRSVGGGGPSRPTRLCGSEGSSEPPPSSGSVFQEDYDLEEEVRTNRNEIEAIRPVARNPRRARAPSPPHC